MENSEAIIDPPQTLANIHSSDFFNRARLIGSYLECRKYFVKSDSRRQHLSILFGEINNDEELVMLHRLRRCRFLTALLAVSILFVSVQPAVNAAIVSTSDLVATELTKIDREYLLSSLERDEVRTALTSQGVDLEMAKQRVASMTDAEVRALNQKMDEMPAGGGIVGAIVLVFLVLLVTDIVGWTDVYPFVKK